MSKGKQSLTHDEPLSYHTSLRVGGPAMFWFRTASDEIRPVLDIAEMSHLPYFVIGNGTNLLVSDAGYRGFVVQISDTPWSSYHNEESASSGAVLAHASAGYLWDTFVSESVALGLHGIECLSGIPGTVGAAPVQNIGAYGQQLSDTLVALDVFDREDDVTKRLQGAECGFGYRSSIFRATEARRFIILGVTLRLWRDRPGFRGYGQVAEAVPEGATVAAVRDTVLALRSSKGMLIDQHRSAGSFFKNPVVSVVDYPEEASGVFLAGGGVKVSAAWLIEHSGFAKGYSRGRVAISRDHALALVCNEYATASDVIALAREIQEGVVTRFGILLEPEVQLVGFDQYPLLTR